MKTMFNFLRKKIGIIGIIGYGNMGKAIAEGIKGKYTVCVFEKDKDKISALKNIAFVNTLVDLVKQSSVVILAVKPQDFDQLLNEIKDFIGDKLIISIAAGITTEYVQKILGHMKVVRVMPNLAVKVAKSTTSICKGEFATGGDLKFVARLFKYLGKVFIFPEKMMNAATAIAGSGPGFLCDLLEGKTLKEREEFAKNSFVPSLTNSAFSLGFTDAQSVVLASSTSAGTISIIKVMDLSPKELKNQVASKNGTTEAGLRELKQDINNLDLAVKAALRRAEELSK